VISDKGFFIYQNGSFKNKSRLDKIGRVLFNWFYLYINHSPALDYASDIEEIYITSQYRPGKNTRHSTGLGIDFTISPIHLMPIFWIILHNYFSFNLFLSIHYWAYDPFLKRMVKKPMPNRHIHCDAAFTGLTPFTRNFKNKKYLEKERFLNPGWLDLVKPSKVYLPTIFSHYQVKSDYDRQFIHLYLTTYCPQNKKNYLTPSGKTNIILEETRKAAKEIIEDTVNIFDTDQVKFAIALFSIMGGLYIIKKILE